MSDFDDFAAATAVEVPNFQRVNALDSEVQCLVGVRKDKIESEADNYVDHESAYVKNFDGIDECLGQYRNACRKRMDKEFSGVTDGIRQYAEQKLLFPQLKQPNHIMSEFKTKFENLVREYVSKVEDSFETSSLICNYLKDREQWVCFPTKRALLDSTISGRVCKTPLCFSTYKQNGLSDHLSRRHEKLTP